MLVLVALSSQAKANQVACENIENEEWIFVYNQKTCRMLALTVINSPNFTISSPRDDSVTGLSLSNKRIFHLPIKVYEKFPNLTVYSALNCSLRTISKLNFENLTGLKVLLFSYNQIEEIDRETFESLPALQWLSLGKF